MDAILNEISHDSYLFGVDDFLTSAWIGHAPFLKFLIREQKPETFVELGVHNGFSYFIGCQAIRECQLSTRAYAIDHWMGDSQAGYFDESIFQGVADLNQKYSDFSTLIRESFADALKLFENASIDLLHIDGFHSYESVKQDFESWLGKIASNGIILLHDIHVRRNTFGVYKFWQEIKLEYKTIEFVGSHGLGVIFLGGIPEGKISDLYQFSKNGGMPTIQGVFGSITDDVIQSSKNHVVSNAIAERDRAIAERDMVLNSTIWKAFKFYRKIRSKI